MNREEAFRRKGALYTALWTLGSGLVLGALWGVVWALIVRNPDGFVAVVIAALVFSSLMAVLNAIVYFLRGRITLRDAIVCAVCAVLFVVTIFFGLLANALPVGAVFGDVFASMAYLACLILPNVLLSYLIARMFPALRLIMDGLSKSEGRP